MIDQALTSGIMPDIRPVPDAGAPGFTVRIVPIRYVHASQMTEILTPFTPPGGTVQVDPQRNLVLLAGSPRQIRTLTELIATFDVDWLEGRSIGLFPLQYAEPKSLTAELDVIFGDTEEGPLAGVVRLVPIDRLRAVLVVTAQPDYLDRAEIWIRRLDQRQGQEEVYVYAVQNGRAADLAEVLGRLFDFTSSAVGPENLLAPGLEPVEISSSGSQFDGEEEEEEEASRHTIRTQGQVNYHASDERQGQTRIVADETTNSLLIRASPGDFRPDRGHATAARRSTAPGPHRGNNR
jgi:general secretion pathway protein D